MIGDGVGWLLAAVLGSLLALDGTSVGQFMLSRPLVACTLAGALAGSPGRGAAMGVILEALHLAVLPVGASRYPEAAPAAVAAATVYVWAGGGYEALLVLAVFALAWEHVGAWTVTRQRSRTARWLEAPGEPATVAALERFHLQAVGLDAARALVVTAVGLVVAVGAVLLLRGGVDPRMARLAAGLTAAAALGSSLRLFGGRQFGWFAAGAAVAAAMLWGGA